SKVMKNFKIIFSIFIIIVFTQCMRDEFDINNLDTDIEIRAGVLTPLAYGSLSFDNIISEFDSSSFISSDADGLLYITYSDSLFSFTANDLLEIPSQDFIQFFIESNFTIPSGWGVDSTVTIDSTKTFPFSFGKGEMLDSMILNQGNLVFDITSQFQIPAKIIITCPTIRKNGSPFISPPIDVGPNVTVNPTPSPLDGYTIYLIDSVTIDSTFKYLPVNFSVELTNNGAGVTAGEDIEINATLENLDFKAIFGYIGDYELVSEAGEIELGFFENTLDGYIRFENPILNLNIGNSYGVPAEINISRFTGFNANEDSIALDLTDNPFRYAYPEISDYINSDFYKEVTIPIDSTNSTIKDFLAFLPSRLEYNISAASNPANPTDLIDSANFVTDASEVNIDLEFILPLYFKADSFALEDTMDINFFEDADYIEKVSVLLEVSNGLPLDIDFQIYFLDSNYNHVDTLFSAYSIPIISSGQVDPATSLVTSPGVKTSLVEFTNERITNLEKVRYGIIRAGLKTPSDSNGDLISVKFFTDYLIDFNLSVSLDFKANL
ncbi:MAG: hypothetical protein PF485_08540, partial [Bacteroidales bacterium]|nr:hypothetical protein [Bacteroidales bacterium]